MAKRNKQAAIPIFYSYSHKDESYRETLETHLAVLKRQNYIDGWHDRRIAPGDNWEDEINLNIQNAKIILLLVSSNFLASDYCYDSETIFALNQHDDKKCVVIPIIIKPCLWKESSFSSLEVLPKDGKAITIWDNEDEAWLNVVEGILNTIKKNQNLFISKKNNDRMKGIEEFLKESLEDPDQVIKPGGEILSKLDQTLIDFLKTYSQWYFSPLRIQKWGGKQHGFEVLSEFDKYSIKTHLENLLNQGKLKTVKSRQGNTIYKLK
ncbi:toll/interleukin-1 receptor domain-containing protein [uncultured Aquimarina sp.]|uniref:toll/interleukin-1 receptor domain-containing protein n=1 Tax=uncultured Aquimarina sp. TaxID=575652 RepID=UPI00261D8A0D|nr:toll/interleukin-1 receptor domain-containing protein [uncultured Aquimarina sp.]